MITSSLTSAIFLQQKNTYRKFFQPRILFLQMILKRNVSNTQEFPQDIKNKIIENSQTRSTLKLIEIDNKYKLFKPGMVVLDCGAAPGLWTQVVVKRVNARNEENQPQGKVIALDLLPMKPIDGATILQNVDFRSLTTQQKVQEILNGSKVNIVLSDMSPNAINLGRLNQESITILAYSVLQFSTKILSEGGTILCKVWDSYLLWQLENDMRRFFQSVKQVRPQACRSNSNEVFMLARKFNGTDEVL